MPTYYCLFKENKKCNTSSLADQTKCQNQNIIRNQSETPQNIKPSLKRRGL